MAERQVTDPELLRQLESGGEVTDPELLRQLEGEQSPGWLSAAMSAAPGIAKAAGSGLVKGAAELAGTPGDIEDLANKGYGAALHYAWPQQFPQGTLGEQVTAMLPEAARPAAEKVGAALHHPTSEQALGALRTVGVPLHEPEDTAERYVGKAAEFVPGALAGPLGEGGALSGMAMNALRFGIIPGLASEGAGDLAEKFAPNSPRVKAAAQIGGAMAAPTALSKLVSPNAARLNPTMEQHAATLRAEGVRTMAGDVLADRGLRSTESELNPDTGRQQLEDFTRATGRRIGLDQPNLTIGQGGNLPQRAQEIGQQFDQIPARNTFAADPQLYQDLLDTHDYYHRIPGLYDESVTNAVDGAVRRVSDVLGSQGHQMTGPEYQTLRSQLRDTAMSSEDSNKSGALHDITNALDDAFERHLQRTGSPDAAAMPQLRRDYQALLTVEKARIKQGGAAAQGVVTPANLQSAAKSIYGNRAYERGNTPFTELAEAGAALLTPRPDSGTPGRMGVHQRAQGIARAIAAPVGFMAGQHMGGGSEGAVGGLLLAENALTPFVERHVAEPWMRLTTTSAPAQWRLANRAVPHFTPEQQAFVRALAGLEAGRPPAPALPGQPPPQISVRPRPGLGIRQQ